jgi:crossover junction endodeoxyribonuclease RuvC
MAKLTHKILALDLSLSSPGYAVLGVNKEGKPVLVEVGHIKTTGKLGYGGRLHQIDTMIDQVLSRNDGIEVIVREKGFSRFAAVTQALFRVVGVADLRAFNHGFRKVVEIAPSAVKKMIAEHGKATKDAVEIGVRNILCLPEYFEFGTDDESDAIAVGLTYYFAHSLIE